MRGERRKKKRKENKKRKTRVYRQNEDNPPVWKQMDGKRGINKHEITDNEVNVWLWNLMYLFKHCCYLNLLSFPFPSLPSFTVFCCFIVRMTWIHFYKISSLSIHAYTCFSFSLTQFSLPSVSHLSTRAFSQKLSHLWFEQFDVHCIFT